MTLTPTGDCVSQEIRSTNSMEEWDSGDTPDSYFTFSQLEATSGSACGYDVYIFNDVDSGNTVSLDSDLAFKDCDDTVDLEYL